MKALLVLAMMATPALAKAPWEHPDEVIVDCVELELNYHGSQPGCQLIVWDWHRRAVHVRHWQFWKDHLKPRKVAGRYHVWIEYEDHDYLIRAQRVSLTRTVHDPEVLDRSFLECDKRRGL